MSAAPKALPARNLCIPAAPVNEVLREQLDYLIGHSETRTRPCGCTDCERYDLVAPVLLEIFDHPFPPDEDTDVPF